MKKVILGILCASLITGCSSNQKVDDNKITTKDPIYMTANLNTNGDIDINVSDINNNVTYYNYEYQGVTIQFFAILDSKGNIKLALNTCNSCIYSHFVLKDGYFICQTCGTKIKIDDLDKAVGCGPILIPTDEYSINSGIITIKSSYLNNQSKRFEKWDGNIS